MNNFAETELILEQVSAPDTTGARISVAVSLFNYARFLPDCLNSIAAQHYQDLELIVVDDQSLRDNSADVARAWIADNAARFSRVLLLRHKRNQGLAQARNTAFRNARAERIFVIDADNEIYPRCIERLSEAMNSSGYDATYSQLEFFGEQTQLGYADVWQKESFEAGNYVDAMALISRRAWQAVGGYTHIEGGWEDYDFWCKFVEHELTGGFVPEILGRYRVHGTSMLRNDIAGRYASIYIEMGLRHPWLRLKG